MREEQHGLPPERANELEARSFQWRRRVALAVFGAGAAYFLLTEHRAHTVQALPWIIVLLCPLMHVFMHRGHGDHTSGRDGSNAHGSPGGPK